MNSAEKYLTPEYDEELKNLRKQEPIENELVQRLNK